MIMKIGKFVIKNIKWDTDGDEEVFESLPQKISFPNSNFDKWLGKQETDDEEELADWVSDFISDEYGFCHDGFEIEGTVLEE